jgi:hypothetical protein
MYRDVRAHRDQVQTADIVHNIDLLLFFEV